MKTDMKTAAASLPSLPRPDAPPTREVVIVGSVLNADHAHLGEELARFEAAGVDRVQWDLMDGHFVPNLSFGPALIAAGRPHTALPFEAQLMVSHPDDLIGPCVEAGCGLVTVHAESSPHLHRSLMLVREAGARAGVALNPATPVEAIAHVLDLVDLVLVMTVNPGFGGQRYLASMEPKIAAVRALVEAAGRVIDVELDGGIGPATIAGAAAAGANVFVAGTAILAHPGGYGAAVADLRARAQAASRLRAEHRP
jgi:ribulose-phosphate 3-epimerase